MRKLTTELLKPEIDFDTTRSSGPGGQNVNKVNSKVILKFDIAQSQILTDEEKRVLLEKQQTKVTKEGVLVITAQDSRSQLQNKETTLIKLADLLTKSFKKKKVRKATKPSKAARQKRIDAKKQQADRKRNRKKFSDY